MVGFVVGSFISLVAMAAIASPGRDGAVASRDTFLRVRAEDDRLLVTSFDASSENWNGTLEHPLLLVSTAEVDGHQVALPWRLKRVQAATNGRRLTFVFESESPKLELSSEWVARAAYGPIEHTITILNKGKKRIVLPLQKSLNFGFKAPASHALESLWVEKSAGGPSEKGVHRDPIGPGAHQLLESNPYVKWDRAYNPNGAERDAIPWITVHDKTASRGWYVGVEFSGCVTLEMKADGQGKVALEAGLANEVAGTPDFRTIVQPGTSYVLPTIFLGYYSGSIDDGCNGMRRWVEANLRPKAADPRYPLLTLNSWGSGMAVDRPLADKMMRDAAKLGIEMYHVDAGWFRGVGDWRADPLKFPNGMDSVAHDAHALGLKFGLWVGWTQGGNHSDKEDPVSTLNALSNARKDWFASDYAADWKPADFTGATLCLANQEARDWCFNLLNRLVTDFHFDMLEHDQVMIVDACTKLDHPHTASRSDIAFHATLGYYGIYDRLRTANPNLLFEDCVNGGQMVDFGAIQRAHYISICDSYFPLANRRAIYDTTFTVPPSMCECYVEAQDNKSLGEFISMLRSGMMGWCTIMQDTNKWTPEQAVAAKRQFDLYKNSIRAFIRNGNLYHVSERPDGKRWDGMQYASQNKESGVLFAFRGANDEVNHTFALHGLSPEVKYRLHFEDGGFEDQFVSGKDLMASGIVVQLKEPRTSQLVFISKA